MGKETCPLGEFHKQMVKSSPAERAFGHVSDLCLYHWSPQSRRKAILRSGLVPGSNSVLREWKPPYVCFADDANLAWTLSGAFHPEIKAWDLWMVYPADVDRWEIIFDTYVATGRHYIKEYRVYHRIYKRHIHYIASREQ